MRTTTSTFAIMRLLATRGVGAAKLRKVIERAERLQVPLPALLEDRSSLQGLLTGPQLDDLAAGQEDVARQEDELRAQGVQLLGWYDEAYPERLRRRLGPPLLMTRGELAVLAHASAGFCGSRKASDKGLAVARDCAEQLAWEHIPIVSGYAAGVDMCTHRTALEAGGSTTLVLAEGILRFRIKRDLKDVWDWSRVCVVSEFTPQTRWSVGNAMQRNRTICGLSDAMILIEARSTGGSVAAGRASLAMGVPLFAPEYQGMPEWAVGNRELLAGGALPLRKARHTDRAMLERVLAAVQAGSRDRRDTDHPRQADRQVRMFAQ